MGIEYQRLPEENYRKLMFQTRSQFAAILNVFRCYGLNDFVDGAIEECMTLTENFGMTVRGKEKPIHILKEPKRKATD